jgi:hypothetical protein
MLTMNTNTSHHPSRDDIARAAYLDWLNAGKPSGCDQKFWLEAEARLRKSMAAPSEPVQKQELASRRTTSTRKA